jgi:hypothetical protein
VSKIPWFLLLLLLFFFFFGAPYSSSKLYYKHSQSFFGLILFFASACFGVLSLWILPFRILDTLVLFRFPWVLHLFSFTCPLEEALHLTLGHLYHISLKEKFVEEEELT